MVSYEKFWRILEEKQISTYALIFKYGIRKSTLDRLKHNQNVTVFTLANLCKILSCDIGDLVECKDIEENADKEV